MTLIGTTLGNQYFIRERVGGGGMADVYLAWDKERATWMAIKVLKSELMKKDYVVEMFKKEAQFLWDLAHPSIVRTYGLFVDRKTAFLVMDWIEGVSLRVAIDERKNPLAMNEISLVLDHICSALNYAHHKQVYHCDIKPANILILKDRTRVFLTDFGVARLAKENSGGGTAPYMAPEQFVNGKVGTFTDVYALGITLYEMLSGGHLPFTGDSPGASSNNLKTKERISWEHKNLPLPPITRYNNKVSPSIEAVISRAVGKNPAERFQSVLEVKTAFDIALRNATMSTMVVEPFIDVGKLKDTSTDKNKEDEPDANGSSKPQPPIANPKGPKLLGVKGVLKGQLVPIRANETTIGRGVIADLRLNDPRVSRQHATLIRTRRGTYLRDEGSSTGTFVNHRGISPRVPIKLSKGDLVQMGNQEFEYSE